MIGFLAKKHNGKDTAADYLVNKKGYVKRSFAEPLKKASKELFGFSDEQLYTDKKEEIDELWGVSPRKVFQVLGTDVVRDLFPSMLLPHIGNNFWVKSAEIWYKNNFETHKGNVVWSDVRFQNEVNFILKNGGIVVKIERDFKENNQDKHSSEMSIDNIDNYTTVIKNDGSLESFYSKIEDLFNNEDMSRIKCQK